MGQLLSNAWRRLMKRLALAFALLFSSLSVRAEDQVSQNTLTPKETADGWILLFDGKTTFGWTSPNGSKGTVADGRLAPQAGKPALLVTTTAFRDYDLSMEFRQATNKTLNCLIGADPHGKCPDDRRPW